MTSELAMPDLSERVPGDELEKLISGKTVWGNYLGGFEFVTTMSLDGTMVGKNQYGVHDSGQWSVDKDNDTLTVVWQGGWVNTTTYAFELDGEVRFHDVATSEWRNSFTRIEPIRSA